MVSKQNERFTSEPARAGNSQSSIHLRNYQRASRGWWSETLQRLLRHRLSVVALIIMGVLIFSSALAPILPLYDRFEMNVQERLQGPSLKHLLGTDETGRDLFSRLVWGGRISMMVALFAVLISTLIGTPWGMLAAYRGGFVDDVLMRIVDGFMAFPSLVFALLIIAALGPALPNLVLTIGILGAPPFARIARGAVLAEREKDYVLAAQAAGVPSLRIAMRHILPNTIAPMIVQFSLAAASAVLTEAALSFLGMGVQPPEASWASLLKTGYSFLSHNIWYVTFPGLAIFLTVWSLNALGDGLRDALDPRLRGTGAA